MDMQKESVAKIVDLIISESTHSTLNEKAIEGIKPFVSININQDKAASGTSEKRPRLFYYMPPPGQMMANTSTNDTTVVKAELEANLEGVLPFDVNSLRYWHDARSFIILKHFAKNILGCCATSAPSERVFSKAGNFYIP